jgi:hypothetical protein
MPRVIDVLHRLLPDGTLPGQGRQWRRAPVWPPDVFACGAVLASMSGAYSRARYTSQWSPGCYFNDDYRATVRTVGAAWANDGQLPDEMSALWSRLLAAGSRQVLEANAAWWDTAMKLMIIADEAAAGIGFLSSTALADYHFFQYTHHVQRLRHRRARLDPRFDLPNLPTSLCWMIPPSEACVQPKARTPGVGFTLRSLSHNLALLPPAGEIETSWQFGTPAGRSTDQALNLLLVPFPFQVDGSCFVGGSESFGEGSMKFFSLRQNWLRSNGAKLSARDLSMFFAGLVDQARREVRNVHGLVLPETALDDAHVKAIARDLAANTGLELFVSGVFRTARARTYAQNKVYAAIFHRHRVFVDWEQAKHHRWRLDSGQVRRYQLGDALDPKDMWWEQIELQPRTCTFYVFRYGASLAALVCEDLARIDPVDDELAQRPNERRSQDVDRLRMPCSSRLERVRKVVSTAHLLNIKLHAQCARHSVERSQMRLPGGRVPQRGDTRGRGNRSFQNLKPLGVQLRRQDADPGHIASRPSQADDVSLTDQVVRPGNDWECRRRLPRRANCQFADR